MKHEQIVCAIADSDCLGDGDAILSGDRLEESALLGGVDDGLGFDQFAGEGLGGSIDLKLYGGLVGVNCGILEVETEDLRG
jgi:hypothetical protein